MKTSKYIAILGAVLAIGCAPQLPHSTLSTPDGWLSVDSSGAEGKLSDVWWQNFNDPTLDQLVDQALVNNRDLLAAMSNVEAARSQRHIARSNYLPSLSFNLDAEREYTDLEGHSYDYSAKPKVSWEIPLFGSLRAATHEANANILGSMWARRGVALSVASETAKGYFTWREAQCNLMVAERSCALRREEVALIDSMLRYGMSDGIAADQAHSLLFQAEGDVALYRSSVTQSLMALAVVVGYTPAELVALLGDAVVLPAEFVVGELPPSVPMILPSDMLERRPDVAESYYRVEAAAAEVGVARAARYPTISIGGGGGVLSQKLDGLSSTTPWTWSVAASLVQPIYSWGRLKSSENVAREEYISALMGYEQSMLQALSEVEQALAAVAGYDAQRRSAVELVGANTKIASSVESLYGSGMSDYLDVIDAERELYSSQMALVAVVTQQYISYITLCEALGGGFEPTF